MSALDLAALADRLVAQVREHLSSSERRYASSISAPTISVGHDDGGDAELIIEWAGSTSHHGWDETAQGARSIIDGAAESLATSIADDFWQTEGWRSRTRSD